MWNSTPTISYEFQCFSSFIFRDCRFHANVVEHFLLSTKTNSSKKSGVVIILVHFCADSMNTALNTLRNQKLSRRKNYSIYDRKNKDIKITLQKVYTSLILMFSTLAFKLRSLDDIIYLNQTRTLHSFMQTR